MTGNMVCKWEKGDKKPSSRYQRLLRELFGRSSTELGFVEDEGYGRPTYPGVGALGSGLAGAGGPGIPGPDPLGPVANGPLGGGPLDADPLAAGRIDGARISPASALARPGYAPRPDPASAAGANLPRTGPPGRRAARPPVPGEGPPPGDTGPLERRMFLRMVATGGLGTPPGPAGNGSAPWERLSAALTRPAPLDAALVSELSLRTAGLYGLEERVPSRALMPRVSEHLSTVTRLLETAPASPHRQRLTSAAGETSALAGWLAYDLGDVTTARSYYRVAAQAAAESSDDALAACVLGYESYQVSAQGRVGEACQLLARARRHALRGVSPVTRSWLAAREAEEQATGGNVRAAMQALDTAEAAYEGATPNADRVWTAFFDRSRLDSMRISTFVRLRQTARAREAAAGALRALGPSPTKKRAVVLADVAEAHAQQGEVEEACRLGVDALAVVAQTDFSLGLDRLRRLSGHLDRWRGLSTVRDLNDQIRAIAVV